VDIIVLTHGQPEATKRCFTSIQEHTRGRYRVIWVDNGSRPEDVEAVKTVADQFETCELMPYETNLGFSKAVNLALQHSLETGKARHVLLLNNDVVVTPGWLERLLMTMEASGFAAIGPLTSEHNPHSLDALRPLVADLPTFNGESPEIRAERLWGRFGQQVLQSTNMVSFFCCLLNKEVVRKTGFLDENLFCYGEDNDYCRRLAAGGHKLGIALGAYVHHDQRVTASSMGPNWVQEQQRKAVEYLAKKWKSVPVAGAAASA
jgi:GT2 family glycosyltransferase